MQKIKKFLIPLQICQQVFPKRNQSKAWPQCKSKKAKQQRTKESIFFKYIKDNWGAKATRLAGARSNFPEGQDKKTKKK
jgi:hypothetical protein